MPVPSVLLSSARNDWTTPEEILGPLRGVAPIGLDPCSNPAATVRPRVAVALPDDGLALSWVPMVTPEELIFVNPPYGRGDAGEAPWVKKCRTVGRMRTVVALVPAKVSVGWWHFHAIPGESCEAVVFLRGRLKFGGAPTGATFPSALILWTPYPQHLERFVRQFSQIGAVWV